MKFLFFSGILLIALSASSQNDVTNDSIVPPAGKDAIPPAATDISSIRSLTVLTVDTAQGRQSVMIPQTAMREVQKDWVEYASRGSKGKATIVDGNNVQYGAINKNISPDQFDIACSQVGTVDGVRVTVWLTGGGGAQASVQITDDRSAAFQKYVRDFAVMEYRKVVGYELKKEQAKEGGMENEMTRLIREEERTQKRSEEYDRSIIKTKEAVKVNDLDIQSTSAKIESQKAMVDNTASDPNASKGARKTLEEMEGHKKYLQKQNDKAGKDILISTDGIRADDRKIADGRERQKSERMAIENQKQVVAAVKAKLDGIK